MVRLFCNKACHWRLANGRGKVAADIQVSPVTSPSRFPFREQSGLLLELKRTFPDMGPVPHMVSKGY